ncbi:hypothetical protein FPZ24_08090 [Sphingomonas panacisoli]|uniref:Uncharacterized protein n=1 Tax=Sphingomonas panacisoli TaxID=1813879 RepID=A0A5B8LH80_9SPHN|nr:hypothetical protein [Sphingomonas panacisoli]QDZ07443.1 hypothetical protein FPZ24_08090 [Sphingomonas panacisoli]
MESADGWIAILKLLGGALGIIMLGLAGYLSGRKRVADGGQAETADMHVVAASFTDKRLLEELISILGCVNETVGSSAEITGELVELLKADAQRRHDEQVVRQALRERGILE